MRTCGDCGWLEIGSMQSLCLALPRVEILRDPRVCAHWKPAQDWRDETCGTCEFRIEGECYRHGGDMKHESQQSWRACAEWMPKEE